jgi:transcriptional regulator GlxA family with amidase domain
MNAAPHRSHSPARQLRREMVKRAETFLFAHIDQSVPIASLCEAVGISGRNLRHAFREVHGMSPKRWAVRARLDVVRRALCQREAAGASVTAIATEHGFFELGRFAGTYKAVFGETPSATLRGESDRGIGATS